MEKKNALAYKNFVIEAENAFNLIVNKMELIDSKELKKYKQKFDPFEFESVYSSFEEELKINCQNYKNFTYIQSFLKTMFSDECELVNQNNSLIDSIIHNGFQVEFLLKLHENINNEKETFNFLCGLNSDLHTKTLYSYYYELLKVEDTIQDKEKPEKPNPKFNFNNLKKEIEKGEHTATEKVKIVHQRLYDFLQWQAQYDTLDEWVIGNESKYKITRMLYPQFEKLCKLEITRLEKLEKMGENISAKPAVKKCDITIASKRKTDFMKILSAMYDTGMFVNNEAKPLTNKQKLMEAFGEFLHEDFGAYSTLLSQAKEKNPDKYMEPFEKISKAGKQYLFDEK